MELDIAPDGRVFYIERDGRLMIWKPDTQQTVTAGTVPVTRQPGERPARPPARAGLRHFSKLGLPLLLAAAGQHEHAGDRALQGQRRHARPGLRAEHPHVPAPARRSAATPAGSLYFGPTAASYIVDGRQHEPVRLRRLQPDRRARRPQRVGRAAHVGQHERPQRQDPAHQADRDPDRHARRWATTYTIPPGNLFAAGTAKTRPEIFGDGLPQPVPLHGRPDHGLGAERRLRPRRRHRERQPRAAGLGRVQRPASAGNYGWPYCIRDNVAYNDYNFET